MKVTTVRFEVDVSALQDASIEEDLSPRYSTRPWSGPTGWWP